DSTSGNSSTRIAAGRAGGRQVTRVSGIASPPSRPAGVRSAPVTFFDQCGTFPEPGFGRDARLPIRAGLRGTRSKGNLMIFQKTKLEGAFVIELERREDARGFFARTFCQHEFQAQGLKPLIAQSNLAYNRERGTLRGMHFQIPPAGE